MSVNKIYKNKMSMFDFIKGVAIFAVVFCHTIENWSSEPGFTIMININGFLGACWMPAFLMSSAYWYKPKDNKTYMKKQIKNYLVPIFIMQIIGWCVFAVVHYLKWNYLRDTLKGVRSLMMGTALQNMTEFFVGDLRVCNIGPAWFVITLCFGSIILNYIMQKKQWKNKIIPIIIVTAVGLMFGKFKWNIYCFSTVLASVLGYYVGYRLKESKFLIRKWEKKDYAIITAVVIVGYYFVAVLSSHGLYCNAVYVVCGIPMGIVAMRLGLLVEKCKDNIIVNFFMKLGRYTFWILMVHTVEVWCIDWNWLKDWEVLAGLPSALNFLIVLAVRLALIAVGCMVVAKGNKIWMRLKEYVISEKAGRVER